MVEILGCVDSCLLQNWGCEIKFQSLFFQIFFPYLSSSLPFLALSYCIFWCTWWCPTSIFSYYGFSFFLSVDQIRLFQLAYIQFHWFFCLFKFVFSLSNRFYIWAILLLSSRISIYINPIYNVHFFVVFLYLLRHHSPGSPSFVNGFL